MVKSMLLVALLSPLAPADRYLGELAFAPDDESGPARRWRGDRLTMLAWERIKRPLIQYRHRHRHILLQPGNRSSRVSMAELGQAFELAYADVGIGREDARAHQSDVGVGWWGVSAQQSVTDVSALHNLLWQVQPDLVLEIGTWCAGSTIFLAKTMVEYNPFARVLTFDLINPDQRWECQQVPGSRYYKKLHPHGRPGTQSPFWKRLLLAGTVQAFGVDPGHVKARRVITKEVARAKKVLVIDDGDHLAAPLIAHFEQLAPLVSPGSYYVIQDTRLDSDCAYSVLVSRNPWAYCRTILLDGGPAAAVLNISAGPRFRSEWEQDRHAEKWVITQHPGGYLRRVRNASEPNAADAPRVMV